MVHERFSPVSHVVRQNYVHTKEEYKKTDKYRKNQKRWARKKEQGKQKEELQKMPDFKVTLSALMTPKNFKMFESQYLN